MSDDDESRDVELRATGNVRDNGPALRTEYRRRFGNEISTDNAREIVSAEYAASNAARTRLSGATQKPAGVLADQLFGEALGCPDESKPRVVLMTAGGTAAGNRIEVVLGHRDPVEVLTGGVVNWTPTPGCTGMRRKISTTSCGSMRETQACGFRPLTAQEVGWTFGG